MLRTVSNQIMARRFAATPTTAALASSLTALRTHYTTGPFTNPVRRNQLTDEERAKVTVDQSQWPENFKDFDPADPYKKFPDWIEGMTSFNIFIAGFEAAFVVVFWELVFPKSI